ncbi:hypothetical protein CAPTEDRAFT_210374 [Capitella teleta]|uniref:EGF-like domain-containing protein n=1 Tax=Capitella teleta TaxID=283909 RepID=N1PB81_CAPTE|nr:hypothetical protein CAPTEDRAFT_210374 [Capitella teleta]|eukprot:ELU18896.1 hypothetical protein CAPTEDRAFT_210374 [Capitella teleta]
MRDVCATVYVVPPQWPSYLTYVRISSINLAFSQCVFPESGTTWWYAYSPTNVDLLRRYGENTLTVSSASTSRDPATSTPQCPQKVDNVNPVNVAVKHPFDFDGTSCDPLASGAYQTTISKDFAGQNLCDGDDSSTAIIDGNTITIKLCSNSGSNSYETPVDLTMTCVQEVDAEEYSKVSTTGSFLILTANVDGNQRFYCARYFVGVDGTLTMSLRLTKNDLSCDLTSTYETVEAGSFIQYAMTPIECPPDYCENGGTCQVDISTGAVEFICICPEGYTGSLCETAFECPDGYCNNGTCEVLDNAFVCTCLNGFTGVTCETEILECESNPCSNGETCVEEINGYTCEAPTTTSEPTTPTTPGPSTTTVEGMSTVPPTTRVDPCASSPCPANETCVANGDNYECQIDDGSSDFPWLPIVIAVGAALLFALMAALIYCCCHYCCAGGDVDTRPVEAAPVVQKVVQKPIIKKTVQAPTMAPAPPPNVDIWRSEAVYTPGLQYPHVVVGEYPLDPGVPVDVVVPFVNGTMEAHPAILRAPQPPAVTRQQVPVPTIIASLGPSQPSTMASDVRYSQQPLIIQEIDDSGQMTGYSNGGRNSGLVIGDDQHVRYEFVNI